MDIQPEMSFRLGYLKRKALLSKLLSKLSNYVFSNADHVIALDKFMKDYIANQTQQQNISVIPVWSVNKQEGVSNKSENEFIQTYGLQDKIVIMYSGNHSIAHPLDTLLDVANKMKADTRFQFVFIGEGVKKIQVQQFKQVHKINNILTLPHQPRDFIHVSLRAADLQVVVLGNNIVGLTHPSKIYTAMNLAIPILYIGPQPSHVTEMLPPEKGNIIANHGEADLIVEKLLAFSNLSQKEMEQIGASNKIQIEQNFSDSKTLELFKNRVFPETEKTNTEKKKPVTV